MTWNYFIWLNIKF